MDGAALINTGILLLLASSVLYFANAYRRLVIRFEQLKNDQDKTNAKAFEKATKMVEDARTKSLEIIETSEEKAEEIITGTDVFSRENQQLLDKKIKEASKEQTEAFRQLMKEFGQDMQATLDQLAKQLQTNATTELSTLREQIEEQVKKSGELIQSQAKQESSNVREDIEEYKAEMIAKVNSDIYKLVKQVVKETTQKVLSNADHEKMVIEALEKAKSEHVF